MVEVEEDAQHIELHVLVLQTAIRFGVRGARAWHNLVQLSQHSAAAASRCLDLLGECEGPQSQDVERRIGWPINALRGDAGLWSS